MRIDIWSDIVCPFCYVGKRNLEQALAEFEHRDEVEVVWHSFELDPSATEHPAGSLPELIAKKYSMPLEQAIASQESLAERAREVGLEFNWRQARYGNTFDAHRVIQYAAEQGLASAAQEAFKMAYFTQGRSVQDHESILDIASEIGLDTAEVEAVLKSDRYAVQVRADEQLAHQLGITGVPFFLFESKWAVNGAQPAEALVQALRHVWEQTRQVELLNPLAGASGDAAGDGVAEAGSAAAGASCDVNGNCS
ncbi:DsbA family oxidoreductase [uncultured Rothia sp.]|uniref:DsbA family oxidoreductase n=1 Tax=uncultured Rothia sp. TaxID=316088 RepID=UPI0026010CD9|nr:DsbA family oxidoreductase [uncultured Rothia sp.]